MARLATIADLLMKEVDRMKAIYETLRDPGQGDDIETLEEFRKDITSVKDLLDAIESFLNIYPKSVIDEEGPELTLIEKGKDGLLYTVIFSNEKEG